MQITIDYLWNMGFMLEKERSFSNNLSKGNSGHSGLLITACAQCETVYSGLRFCLCFGKAITILAWHAQFVVMDKANSIVYRETERGMG